MAADPECNTVNGCLAIITLAFMPLGCGSAKLAVIP